MDSREVVHDIFSRRPAERYAAYDHFWPETIRDYWPREGYPRGADPEEHFDLDILNAGAWLDTAIWRDRSEVVEESPEWRVVRDGRGATLNGTT